MSFSENPYKHMDIMVDGVNVAIHCSSCGSERIGDGVLSLNSTIGQARRTFDNHVLVGHRRTRDDFAGWA
jgi:hypothetical protein